MITPEDIEWYYEYVAPPLPLRPRRNVLTKPRPHIGDRITLAVTRFSGQHWTVIDIELEERYEGDIDCKALLVIERVIDGVKTRVSEYLVTSIVPTERPPFVPIRAGDCVTSKFHYGEWKVIDTDGRAATVERDGVRWLWPVAWLNKAGS